MVSDEKTTEPPHEVSVAGCASAAATMDARRNDFIIVNNTFAFNVPPG